jgi:regulator of nonsense transcripts 1
MEGAFTHLGNHLISDSTSKIVGGDDESILDGHFGGLQSRRRRHDEDDDTEYDDTESVASLAIGGVNGKQPNQEEEQVELPPHACAYVFGQCGPTELS